MFPLVISPFNYQNGDNIRVVKDGFTKDLTGFVSYSKNKSPCKGKICVQFSRQWEGWYYPWELRLRLLEKIDES